MIRTMEDRGVIGLLDERFREAANRSLFPREWSDLQYADSGNITEVLKTFWESAE